MQCIAEFCADDSNHCCNYSTHPSPHLTCTSNAYSSINTNSTSSTVAFLLRTFAKFSRGSLFMIEFSPCELYCFAMRFKNAIILYNIYIYIYL